MSSSSYNYIEYQIGALVQALNSLDGVNTVASCAGHWDGRQPYVYFYAPISIAREIESAIRSDGYSQNRKIKGHWEITAQFDPNGALVFTLRCARYQFVQPSSLSALWHFVIRRKNLNKQLKAMADVIEQMAPYQSTNGSIS